MNLVGMHMADGLISVNIGLVFTLISVVMIGVSIREMYKTHDYKKIPMMAVMGAFIFAGQMINFTIPGTGSSGHIVGGILLCVMLGEYPAFLSLACVLIIQCFFFGDGGLLALGCNIFNMGVIPVFIAYPLIVRPILKKGINEKNIIIACILGVVVGLEIGAFSVVVETLLSGISELPFVSFIGLMLPIHLAIGLVEGIVTSAVVIYVMKSNVEILNSVREERNYGNFTIKKTIGVFACLVVLISGGLSIYASSNPDGLEWSILNVTGKEELDSNGSTKENLAKIQATTSILPDYNFIGNDSVLGGSAAGIIGCGATLVLIGGIGFIVLRKKSNE